MQARPGCGSDGRGFGHIGFLVDDVYAACDALEPLGYGFKKKPDEGEFRGSSQLQICSLGCLPTSPPRCMPYVGGMKGLAFAYDPDGYWVEIVKRGGL